jgi:actin-related protein
VIDNGSFWCKVGVAGEDAPRSVFPALVARPRASKIPSSSAVQDPFVGENAINKRGALNVTSPISRGQIEDWNDMERIWHHAFYNEARVIPEYSGLLITSSLWQSEADKAKMAEILLEGVGVASLALVCPEALAMLASGRDTGLVIHSGYEYTTAVPIWRGQVLRENSLRTPWGGNHLTSYLATLCQARSVDFSSTEIFTAVEEMKKKVSYCALDFSIELARCESAKQDIELSYELPDGSMLQLDSERFSCTEPCFQPSLFSKITKNPPNFGEKIEKLLSLPELLLRSVSQCDALQHKDLYQNVIMEGGNTMFPGLEERIHAEMRKLPNCPFSVHPIAPPERKFSDWIGGSILASSSGFADRIMTKAQYEELGPGAINRLDVTSLIWA